MTVRTPLVIVNGQVQQLQAGDDLNVSTAMTDVRTVLNGESSAALVICAPVYVNAAGSVRRAQANALATSRVLGLVYEPSIAAGDAGRVAVNGILVATTTHWDAVTGSTGGLTSGAQYFLDPATAGKLTSTPPTVPGQVVVPVGIAISTTEFEINEGLSVLL